MFNRVSVELKGFRDEELFLQEMSIRQLRQAPKSDDDFALMMYAVENGLVNSKGEKIINSEYTIEEFENEAPQHFIEELADAFTELNAPDEKTELETAKNS